MLKLVSPLIRPAALVLLLGTSAFSLAACSSTPDYDNRSAQYSQTTVSDAQDNDNRPDANDEDRRTDWQNRIEERISELHDRLDITPAQEGKWNAVANAMRQNQKDVGRAFRAKRSPENDTAPENLSAYGKIASAHSRGLQRLIPPFRTLYASMSAEQRANADEVFSRWGMHGKMRPHRGEE